MKEGELNALLKIENDRPALSLDIPKGTSFEEWVNLGRQLCASSQVVNWYIGDWWAFGTHRYGARAAAAAEGVFGLEFQALKDIGMVSRAFTRSRRRDALSFTHHREVAALDPAQADAFLDRAETEGWSTRNLRKAIMQARSPSGRVVDCIDINAGRPEPICAQLLTPDEIIVELAEALGRERALTDRESGFLEMALRRIDGASGPTHLEPWDAEQDLTLIRIFRGGATGTEIAAEMSRSEDSIWSRIRNLRRRGLLEPSQRSQSPVAQMPADEG